jgi:hypothetical protein
MSLDPADDVSAFCAAVFTVCLVVVMCTYIFDAGIKSEETQPAIQTAIVTVRGCDVIQHIQGDKLIAAHNAADQPKSCKVQGVKS